MMRCITAIWPAGPPKLRAATLSHTRSASPSEGNWRDASVAACAARTSDTSRSRFLPMPRVGFVCGVAAPAVERIVERHPGFELSEIVRIHPRQTERGGKQTGGLRRDIHASGVRPAHDRRKAK